MSQIRFEPPDPDEPGYLKRQRKALEFQRQLTKDPAPEAVDALVEFLLPYVKEPVERDAARDALWDASEAQFRLLIDLVSGRSSEDTNPT